jgi:hypothetical protein
VSRAQRSTKWCAADTDLGFTRDRRPYARKSGKPDLRGPFQSVAVPDQRCTAPLCSALHRIRDTRYRRSFLSHDLQQHTLPRRGALLRERAFAAARAGWSDPCIFLFFCRFGSSIPGLTISNNTHFPLPTRTPSFPRRILRPGFASLLHSPRIEGWAERRETFGCSAEHPWGVYDAIRQAPSEAPCVP